MCIKSQLPDSQSIDIFCNPFSQLTRRELPQLKNRFTLLLTYIHIPTNTYSNTHTHTQTHTKTHTHSHSHTHTHIHNTTHTEIMRTYLFIIASLAASIVTAIPVPQGFVPSPQFTTPTDGTDPNAFLRGSEPNTVTNPPPVTHQMPGAACTEDQTAPNSVWDSLNKIPAKIQQAWDKIPETNVNVNPLDAVPVFSGKGD